MHYFYIFLCFLLFIPASQAGSAPQAGSASQAKSASQAGSASQVVQKEDQSFNKGLKLFQNGQLSLARTSFENINRQDSYFVPALVEMQKINYQKNQWGRFFGLALYYRNLLLSDPKSAHKNFKQNPLALEILALIRHCRFKESQKVKEWSLKMAKTLNLPASQIKKTNMFFNLKKLVGDQKKQNIKNIEEQISLWPLKNKELKWMDNPKNLRVKVSSQCSKTKKVKKVT